MTSAQLMEWRAFFRLERIPEAPLEAHWMQSAIVAATVANHAFGRKGPAAKLEEFIPKFTDPVDPDQALYESMSALRTRPPKPSGATAPAPGTKRKAITSPKAG